MRSPCRSSVSGSNRLIIRFRANQRHETRAEAPNSVGDFALTGLEAGGILRHPGRPSLRRILRITLHLCESWKTRQTVLCRILFVNERSTHSPLAPPGRRVCSCLQFSARRRLPSFPSSGPAASISRAFHCRTHSAVATGRRPVPIPSQLALSGWGRCRIMRADAATWMRVLGKRPRTIDRVTGR
jgi:hypothetical protein